MSEPGCDYSSGVIIPIWSSSPDRYRSEPNCEPRESSQLGSDRGATPSAGREMMRLSVPV